LAAKALPGHVAVEPVQFSATSQLLTAPRQTVDAAANAFAGQAAEEPVHCSATSQSPADARQTVEGLRNKHCPSSSWRLHAWQSLGLPPPQVELQQKPSRHWLLLQ
jgi:hypothetical protein